MAKKPIKKTLGNKSKKVLVDIIEDAGSDTEYANDGDMYDSNSDSDSEPESNKKINNAEIAKENDDEVDDDDKFGDELDDKDEDEKNDDDDDDDVDDNENNDQDDDKCFYKYANKKNEFSDEEEEEEEEDIDDDTIDTHNGVQISTENRITKPRLTKYEYVRLLTDRTKQLSLGAKPMIKNIENLSDLQIARLEITNNVVPLIIERPLPNGQFEVWKISELEIDLVN